MDSNYDLTKFYSALEELHIELSEMQMNQFLTYYEMLISSNKLMNLTAITEFEEVVLKHFIDSLCIVRTYDMSKVKKLIDVGTGAGFPAIPIKIVFPDIEIMLLDSLNKRLDFLKEVSSELKFKGIETVHGRSEDIGRDLAYREQYDLCVSRAVAKLATLSELCLPFVKKDGAFIAYKAGGCEDEIKSAENAVKTLGGRIEEINTCVLPNSDIERVFVKIRKIEETPKRYPRKAGTPSKEPLK